MSLGDFVPGQIVYYKFTTYNLSSGLPLTLAGSPVVSVYKDDDATQSTAGMTFTADFDGVVGLNQIKCDTSADGTFYSAGSFFEFIVTTGTISGSSIAGAKIENFTIAATSALRPTTAGRTLDVSATGEADSNVVQWLGTAVATPTVAGVPEVDITHIQGDGTSATDLKDFADAGYDPATNKVQGVVTVDSTTVIATDGITATSISTAALTDIEGAIWNAVLASYSTPGSTGEALADAAAGAGADPWGVALPGAYSAGEAGFILGTNLNALITSRMATYTQPAGFLATTFSTDVASTTNITAGTITTVGTTTIIAANGITATSLSTGALTDIQATVWDADLSLYQDAGSTGEALGVAGTAGDPWTTLIPGAYTVGMAGYIVGNNLNASISSVNDNINGVQQATIIRDAVNVLQFPMYLTGTDDDPAIGKTVTAQVSDETGAYSACTGTVTEIGLGAYAFTTSIADTATESGSFMFSASGCKNTLYPFKTSE